MRIAQRWNEIEIRSASADLSIDGALKLIAAPAPITKPKPDPTRQLDYDKRALTNTRRELTRERRSYPVDARPESSRKRVKQLERREARLAERVQKIKARIDGASVPEAKQIREMLEAAPLELAAEVMQVMPRDMLDALVAEVEAEQGGEQIDAVKSPESPATDSPAMMRFRGAMAAVTRYSAALAEVTIPHDISDEFGMQLIKDLRELTRSVNLFRAQVENMLVARRRAT